jgi:hypothetical protein
MTQVSAPVRVAAFALLAALAACGPVKRINPPAASVQRLALAPGGQLVLELRVQNHSDLTTRVARFDGEISLDGRAPQAIAVPIDLDVPAHAAEVVSTTLAPGDAIATDRSLPYRLLGRITTDEPRGSYEVEHESMLSPVPGRPGEFR